jgi:lysophospholipase L1-like esterase
MRVSILFCAVLLLASLGFAGESPAPVTVPGIHPNIQIIGRVDDSSPLGPRFSFPGVTIRARFEAPSIALLLADESLGDEAHINVYTVIIDDVPRKPLVPAREVTRYLLAEGLSDGPHTVEIRKRTEGLVGAARLLGFELPGGGQLLEPPARSSRRIEFIGDSITCGFGNLATDDPPKIYFTSFNEDHDLAYGALTAAMLGAESHTVAYSGRGVYRSHLRQVVSQIPIIYHRALADDKLPRWNHRRWTPDVIVINLGTNDFFEPGLRDRDFQSGYSRFLAELRTIHPNAVIVCCVGPMLTDDYPVGERSLTRSRELINGIIEQRAQKGDTKIHFHEFEVQTPPFGEAMHPSRATHRKMAESLSARLVEIMNWSDEPQVTAAIQTAPEAQPTAAATP